MSERQEAGPSPANTEPIEDAAILDQLIDLAAKRPDPDLMPFHSRASAHQYLPLFRMFRRHVPPGAEVLDWGAGTGHFSFFLLRAGYRATAYSFGPCLLHPWLDRPGYRFVEGRPSDPIRLPFESATFDAVASVGVLEHVRETGGSEPESMREIARVIKPGGTFVCFHFPNRWSLIDFLARRSGRHHHVYRYRTQDILTLAHDAGFGGVESGRYAFLPRNMLHTLPGSLRSSRAFATAWDVTDGMLVRLFSPLCQNHWFIARKGN